MRRPTPRLERRARCFCTVTRSSDWLVGLRLSARLRVGCRCGGRLPASASHRRPRTAGSTAGWRRAGRSVRRFVVCVDRSSRPHHSPRRLTAAEEEPILRARRETNLGPGRLAGVVRRARSTIWKVLWRHGLSRRRAPVPRVRRGVAVPVDPRDPDAIAAGLREAIERRDELGVLGRERAKDFSWRRAAEAHVELYREAAA
jgi:hypothetical protein